VLLFGIGTKGRSIMGFEDEVEQSSGAKADISDTCCVPVRVENDPKRTWRSGRLISAFGVTERTLMQLRLTTRPFTPDGRPL
jgi:hypothetical protein